MTEVQNRSTQNFAWVHSVVDHLLKVSISDGDIPALKELLAHVWLSPE